MVIGKLIDFMKEPSEWTVAELITELSQYPDDAPVQITGSYGASVGVFAVDFGEVVEGDGDEVVIITDIMTG